MKLSKLSCAVLSVIALSACGGGGGSSGSHNNQVEPQPEPQPQPIEEAGIVVQDFQFNAFSSLDAAEVVTGGNFDGNSKTTVCLDLSHDNSCRDEQYSVSGTGLSFSDKLEWPEDLDVSERNIIAENNNFVYSIPADSGVNDVAAQGNSVQKRIKVYINPVSNALHADKLGNDVILDGYTGKQYSSNDFSAQKDYSVLDQEIITFGDTLVSILNNSKKKNLSSAEIKDIVSGGLQKIIEALKDLSVSPVQIVVKVDANNDYQHFDNNPNPDPEVPVTNNPPVADFYFDVSADGVVIFSNNSSDPENDKLTYKWNFGDNAESNEASPTHKYKNNGKYTVYLNVTDSGKLSNYITKEVNVDSVSEGDNDKPVDPDNPVIDNEIIAMQVIDGYFVSVPVCVSIDGETCLEGDEYVRYTDNNGKVLFNKKALKSLFKTYDKIKLIAVAPKDTKSIVAGTEILSTKDVVLTRTLFSEDLNSTNDSNVALITPFSTLADMTNPQSKEEYRSSVNQIGEVYDDHSHEDLLSVDYNYEMNKWLIISEFLGRFGFLPSSFANLKEKNNNNLTIEQIKDNIRGISQFVDYLLDNQTSGNTAEAIESTHESLGQSFKKLSSGTAEEWRCGITQTNNAYCWGLAVDWCTLGNHEYCASHESVWDPYNPLRGADQHMYSYKPVPVEHEIPCNNDDSETCYENLQGVIDLSFSHRSACAVTIDGYVYCWGENFDGEGGQGEPIKADGSNTRLEVAKKVVNTADRQYENPYLNNIKQVIHGQKFACALSNNGEVFCWGINGSQQLGGTYDNLVLETTWQSADNNDSLGDVDKFGKPIVEARKYSPTPIQVRFPEEVKLVNKLFAGRNIACVTVERNDNDPHNVYCWGSDSDLLISNNDDNLIDYYKKAFNSGYIFPTNDRIYGGISPYYFSKILVDGDDSHILDDDERHCSNTTVDSIYQCYNYYGYGTRSAFLSDAEIFGVVDPLQGDINCRYKYGDSSVEATFSANCFRDSNLKINQNFVAYTQQIEQKDGTLYPISAASQGVTNNPIFENATDIDILDNFTGPFVFTNNFICAIVDNNDSNRVQCIIGREDFYDFDGDFVKDKNQSSPFYVKDNNGSELKNVIELASSNYYLYIMTKNGLVYSNALFNENNYNGLLGLKNPNVMRYDSSNIWLSIPHSSQINLFNAISMSANLHSVCVTYKKNDINYETKCWGSNLYGQTGYANGEDYPWQWVKSNDNWNTIFKDPLNYFTEPTVMGESFKFDNPKE